MLLTEDNSRRAAEHLLPEHDLLVCSAKSIESPSKRKTGGTFFVKKVPPNPLQETLTLAGILISPQEK
jgi:hypothetical protein